MPKMNGESELDQKLDLIFGVMNELLEQMGEVLDRLNNLTPEGDGFGYDYYETDDDAGES